MIIPALIFALFASTFTIGQAALLYTQPVFLIALRMTLAGLVMLTWVLINKKTILANPKFILAAGFIHIYVPYVTEFWGLQYVGSAKAALLYSVMPFVTAIIERYTCNFKLTRKKIIGMAIGLIGLLPIILNNSCIDQANNCFYIPHVPELAILISAVTASFGWIIIKKGLSKGYTILEINGSAMLVGGLFAFATSLVVDAWAPIPSTNFQLTLLYTGLLILIGNFLYYNLYGSLLKKYSATFLSFLGFTIPIFAAIYQWLFFGQIIGLDFIVSSIITIIGLYIFYRDEFATH